jgi:hypothetical protein
MRAREWGLETAELLGSKDPTLEKVIGFGSAFETWRHFREDSDVDLAIVGGDWSFLSRILPKGEFSVSLVELNLQNPEFISHVIEHGEVLYERE